MRERTTGFIRLVSDLILRENKRWVLYIFPYAISSRRFIILLYEMISALYKEIRPKVEAGKQAKKEVLQCHRLVIPTESRETIWTLC